MGLETQIYIRLCCEKGERQGSVVTEVQNESVLHVYAAIAKNTLYFKVKIDYGQMQILQSTRVQETAQLLFGLRRVLML